MLCVLRKRNRIDLKSLRDTLLRWGKAVIHALIHHPVTVIVVLLLSGVVWWFGQKGTTDFQAYEGTQVALTEPDIGQIQLIQMLQKGAKVCAYETQENQMVAVRRPDRQAKVELCHVIGDMELLPVTLEEGSFPIDKKRQCVIDIETAYQLFGSENGVHSFIWIGDIWYEVSAVVKSCVPGVFVYDQDPKTTFSRIIVLGTDEQRQSALALLPPDTMLSKTEYESVNETVAYLTQLPIWMAGILFFLGLVFGRKRSIQKTIGVSVVTVIYLYLTGIHFYLPQSLIPERWSRLEFYSNAISQCKDNILHYLQMIQAGFEAQYITCAVRVVIITIVLLLLEVCVAAYIKRWKAV